MDIDPVSARVKAPVPEVKASVPQKAPETQEIKPTLTLLDQDAWQHVFAPATVAGNTVLLQGKPQSPSAYGAVSATYRLPAGARVAVAGEAVGGGVTLGLLNAHNRWAATLAVPSGKFREMLAAPEDGEYRIVLAYNLPSSGKTNDARVTEVGLIDIDSKSTRVRTQDDAQLGEVVPFYAFPAEVRRLLYTTNAIEALNSKLRRAVRTRGHFPTDEAALKLLFLVLNRSEKEWTMPAREWCMAKAQFAILFGERFTRAMV